MAGFTNRGKYKILEVFFRKDNIFTNLNVALCTSAVAPTADTNTFGELTEIAAGNGYTTGGIQLNMNSTDFDVLTEDDTNDRALLQIKDLVWSASGGPIPSAGAGARWAVLTDDNGTIANRQVLEYWDLTSARTVTDTNALTLQDCEMRFNES